MIRSLTTTLHISFPSVRVTSLPMTLAKQLCDPLVTRQMLLLQTLAVPPRSTPNLQSPAQIPTVRLLPMLFKSLTHQYSPLVPRVYEHEYWYYICPSQRQQQRNCHSEPSLLHSAVSFVKARRYSNGPVTPLANCSLAILVLVHSFLPRTVLRTIRSESPSHYMVITGRRTLS